MFQNAKWHRHYGIAAHSASLSKLTAVFLMGMKPLRVKIFKGVLLFEMVGLLGAYFLYYRMDKNQDFRHKMNMRFPSVLELYYKSNEWAGIHGIREKDQLKWLSSKN
ncbi:protein CEBPZOS isoform X2 [Pelodiscus sinensis]|uniref:protein CEBPZOS isoform X2 n=1 Tax=Pelodiscus sinensis TaxID=13735 RepID=UPI003F6CFA83